MMHKQRPSADWEDRDRNVDNQWLLIAGGTFEADCLQRVMAEHRFSQIVAIDGGADYCRRAGLRPTLAVGDFDTASEETVLWLTKERVERVSLPAQKDMTDTAAAVDLALAEGADSIHLVAALGSRFDHSYGNLLLMMRAMAIGGRLHIHSANQHIFLLPAGVYHLQARPDFPYLSMFAWMGEVEGLTIEGVAYPLKSYTLKTEDPLCISNEWCEDCVRLSFLSGSLLVIEAKD